jgi:hypothetical protein
VILDQSDHRLPSHDRFRFREKLLPLGLFLRCV